MNIEKMEQLKAFLQEDPRRFHQDVWIETVDPEEEGNPPCGTICCLAGAVAMMEGYTVVHPRLSLFFPEERVLISTVKKGKSRRKISGLAREILGLTRYESKLLFEAASLGWSVDNRIAYDKAKTPQARVKAAIAEIDRLIALEKEKQCNPVSV